MALEKDPNTPTTPELVIPNPELVKAARVYFRSTNMALPYEHRLLAARLEALDQGIVGIASLVQDLLEKGPGTPLESFATDASRGSQGETGLPATDRD